MKRIITVLAFSFAASGAAFACEGEKSSTATSGAHGDKAEGSSHCNMPSTTTTAALPAEGKRVKLTVAGMHCGACAEKVQAALIGVEGVKGATVDAATGVAEVAYDEKKATTAKLVAAVAATNKFTATVATN